MAKSDELLDQVLQSEKLMMQYMRQEYVSAVAIHSIDIMLRADLW